MFIAKEVYPMGIAQYSYSKKEAEKIKRSFMVHTIRVAFPVSVYFDCIIFGCILENDFVLQTKSRQSVNF